MGEAALFKASTDAAADAGAKAEAAANAEAAWYALSVGDQRHAVRVWHSAARTAKRAAAVARNAKRAAAAAAAAAPAAPPQLGAPGTSLPSADRLRVLCVALKRAAAAAGRRRVRVPRTGATLVVSKGAYREATGAGMTRRAEAAAVAVWAAAHPGMPRESLTAGCSLKVTT